MVVFLVLGEGGCLTIVKSHVKLALIVLIYEVGAYVDLGALIQRCDYVTIRTSYTDYLTHKLWTHTP